MKFEKCDHWVNKYHSYMFESMTSGNRRILLLFCFLLGPARNSSANKRKSHCHVWSKRAQDFNANVRCQKFIKSLVTFHTSESFGGNNFTFSIMDLTIKSMDFPKRLHTRQYRNSKKVTFPLLSVIGFTNVETITFSILDLTRLKTLWSGLFTV